MERAMNDESKFLGQAIALARANIGDGGRPFGAVLVRDGKLVATGVNRIHATNDPTAHAEMTAIRAASQQLGSPNLSGCEVYASGHPCPMCLAAMRMAGVGKVVYAYSNEDAEPFGLSTAAVYDDLAKPLAEQSMTIHHAPVPARDAVGLYEQWAQFQRERQG